MYNPRIELAIEMVKQVHDRHMAEIAWIELSWEKVYNGTLPNGEPKLIQVVPVILTQAKG